MIPLQTVLPNKEHPVKIGEILGEARVQLKPKAGLMVFQRAVLKDDGLLHEINLKGETIETHPGAIVVQFYRTKNT